jgi:hypothetical protein
MADEAPQSPHSCGPTSHLTAAGSIMSPSWFSLLEAMILLLARLFWNTSTFHLVQQRESSTSHPTTLRPLGQSPKGSMSLGRSSNDPLLKTSTSRTWKSGTSLLSGMNKDNLQVTTQSPTSTQLDLCTQTEPPKLINLWTRQPDL